MNEIITIIFSSLMGFLFGFIASLLPGLHINTLSMLILSFYGLFYTLFRQLGADPIWNPLFLSAMITSAYIASTFSNIIPATFIGAPDEDVALTLLPAHSLLIKGKGYEAIVLSSFASFGSAVFTLVFLFPLKFILANPLNLYDSLQEIFPFVLLFIILIMIFTEKDIRTGIYAFTILILSGIFGILILGTPILSPINLPTSPLFPALAGLFGLSTLISSFISEVHAFSQDLREPTILKFERKTTSISILLGTLSGIFVSIVPGITASIGTIIALILRGKTDERQAIMTLSAVNTSAAISTVANLFILQRARSGVAIIVDNLIHPDIWEEITPPPDMLYLIISIIISTSLSLPTTCLTGKIIAKELKKISYRKLTLVGIIFLILLTLIFCGILGFLILLIGMCIGLIPIFTGARRSNCMGVLIIPLLLQFLKNS